MEAIRRVARTVSVPSAAFGSFLCNLKDQVFVTVYLEAQNPLEILMLSSPCLAQAFERMMSPTGSGPQAHHPGDGAAALLPRETPTSVSSPTALPTSALRQPSIEGNWKQIIYAHRKCLVSSGTGQHRESGQSRRRELVPGISVCVCVGGERSRERAQMSPRGVTEEWHHLWGRGPHGQWAGFPSLD